MTEGQKRVLVIVVAVLAVGAAGYSVFNSMTSEKEQIVGTLPMPEGGGRDAEAGKASGSAAPAADPSGMPPEMAGPGGGGKQ
jgi:hypothetical protein